MDNNLKDFLESAHQKFNSTPTENEINILLVGCDDEEDIQNWYNYLWAEQGLFTSKPFSNSNDFNNVDLVVYTNQYFIHNSFSTKKLKEHWSIEKSFNLIFKNPHRLLNKNKGIEHFMKILPNCTSEFNNYVVPGPAPQEVKDSVVIRYFVKDYLEKTKGRYYFGER